MAILVPMIQLDRFTWFDKKPTHTDCSTTPHGVSEEKNLAIIHRGHSAFDMDFFQCKLCDTYIGHCKVSDTFINFTVEGMKEKIDSEIDYYEHIS